MRDIFERFGRVTRVFLAKDRETGRAKGFAFISYQERSDAAKACEKIDGCEFDVLSQLPFTLLADKVHRRLWSLNFARGICKEGNLEFFDVLNELDHAHGHLYSSDHKHHDAQGFLPI